MFLYHITHKDNYDSIMLKGLIPGYKKGMSRRLFNEKWGHVFLTDNIDYIREYQWDEIEVQIIFSVYCGELNIRPFNFFNEYRPHEYIFEGIIHPNKLELYKNI